MKKFILMWLFGTKDIKEYVKLLSDNVNYSQKHLDVLNAHMATLQKSKGELELMRKLIRVCENHGIDVDKEIKKIEL